MYCTLADIKKTIPEAALVQLTDDDSLGVVDEAKVDEAISSAGGEIDGYLAGRYQVPIDPVPALVAKCAVDIATYNLYSRVVESVPETRKDRYKNAVRILENIAAGKLTLGETPAPAATPASSVRASAPARIFSDDKLNGY